MTAIAAVVHDGKVYVGGDSAGVGVRSLSLEQRSDPKVFVNGPYVMGFTSSFRMGQLLHWAFTPPTHHSEVEDERFMSTAFVDAVRSCLKAGGYAKKENDVESAGTFIVGYHGKLWVIEDDYQVAEPLADFTAVGCGYNLCLGSLHSTETIPATPPAERIILALGAAERFSAGVRGPFTVAVEP